MTGLRLWDRCIQHRGLEARQFIADYFGKRSGKTLLIAGLGFDPRSTTIVELLSTQLKAKLTAVLVREDRPDPANELLRRAHLNRERISMLTGGFHEVTIDIFASDGAVIGGRNAASAISKLKLTEYQDVVVDFSALSVGVSFPITRWLYEYARDVEPTLNLHIMVTDEPSTDEQIYATICDIVDAIHGFKGGLGLFDNTNAARLWLPQLTKGRNTVLGRIHTRISPHDVCPILPFPASHPRLADALIESYSSEIESVWAVDTRNFVYAAENNPLDLYRTVLRIDDARRPVFQETGGSMIILSPVGSKVLAIGALMAALERGFPVVNVEAVSYEVDFDALDSERTTCGDVVHVWLSGDVYPNAETEDLIT